MAGPAPSAAVVVPRADHSVSRSMISPNALKVLYRLQRSGFLAFLVGGAVRDILLGRKPKDFDIGTNARPQQVRQLFRNARLIGRRFRLARILFADEVVEVATFRRMPEAENDGASDVLSPTVEDDQFGTPAEDAWRRDFTINALFYNIADFSVIDHVGGLADLEAGIVRSVGPARVRFAEDPVRMMRAVEYSARLGFRIEDEAAEAVEELGSEIRRAAPARIAYELTESLTQGCAEPIFRKLDEFGLLGLIVPEAKASDDTAHVELMWSALRAADDRLVRHEPVVGDALLGVLMLPAVWPAVERVVRGGERVGDLERNVREVVDSAANRLALSNFTAHVIRNAYTLLPRFVRPPRSPKHAIRTVRREAFPAAWQLVELLAPSGVFPEPALAAWRTNADRVTAGLPPVVDEAGPIPRRRARGRRPRRRREASGAGKT